MTPRLFVDLLRAYRAGNREEAARLQTLADPLRQAFSLSTFPSVIKHALELIGLPAGPCRKPVGPMRADSVQKLVDVLDRLRDAHYLPEAAVEVRA